MGNDIASLIATGIAPMPHVDTPTEAAAKAFQVRNAMIGGQDQHALSGESLKAAQIENKQRQMDLEDQQTIRAIMQHLQASGSPDPQASGPALPPQVQAAMRQPDAVTSDQPAGNLVPGLIGVTNGDIQEANAPDTPIASSTSVAPATQGAPSRSPDYDALIRLAGPLVQPKTLLGLQKLTVGLQDQMADVRKKGVDADKAQGELEQSHREALSSMAAHLEANPEDWDTAFAVAEHGTQGAYKNELESLRQFGNQSPDVRGRLIAQMKAGGMKPTDQAALVNTQTEAALKKMELSYRQQYDGLSAPERSAEIQKQQALAVEAQRNNNQKAYQDATIRLRTLEVDPGGMVSTLSGGGQPTATSATPGPVAPGTPQQGATAPQVQPGASQPQSQPQSQPINDGRLHGAAFLKTLPPMLADQVKALSEGRSQITARGGSGFQGLPLVLRNAVQQYDPTFSENRFNARKEFDAGGTYANNAIAASTALGHLSMLHDAGDALNQNQLPVINDIANKIGVHAGKDPVAVYQAIASKLAPELMKTYISSGAGTEGEIHEQAKDLLNTNSPGTRHAVERTVAHLLDSKMGALRNQWKSSMGPNTPAWEPLSPEAQQAREKLLSSASALPKGNGQKIDAATAKMFYDAAGHDPVKAKKMIADANFTLK